MRPRRRDPAFLRMAIVAASGGVLAIVAAIGFPLWGYLHGRAPSPAFALFAGWGLAALGGAYACWNTYRVSIGPDRPPRGGIRLYAIDGGASDERDVRRVA